MAGLDGLRGIAVSAVVLYHINAPWAPGGLLGVGVFFTLSGYLITDLLLCNWETSGSLQLRQFWARRARRLLPALAVMLAVVSVWTAVARPAQLDAVRDDVAAAIVYMSNWWLIFQHVSYFARFGPPAPLGHLWSLAVEEQFYLAWPWLLLVGLWLLRRRPPGAATVLVATPVRRARPKLWPLAAAAMALALASAFEMALLYQPSLDPSRVYDGTDTRAFALFLGAALAMVWPSRGLKAGVSRGAQALLDATGALGLGVIVGLVAFTNQYSAFLYRGGMFLLGLASAVVVASAAHPASRFGLVLGTRPLKWLGARSYGVYLWHYPVIVLTSPPYAQGVDWPRAGAQVLLSLALAALSWRFIEEPVRHGALGRLWHQLLVGLDWRDRAVRRRLLAISAMPLCLALCAGALAGLVPTAASGPRAKVTGPGHKVTGPGHKASGPGAKASGPGDKVTGPVSPVTTTTAVPAPTTTITQPRSTARPIITTTTKAARPTSLRTSCRQVVHVGDSTSESLVSDDYLPDAGQRLPAQYARVGVSRTIVRIQGGRSIVETIDNQPDAYQVARSLVSQGYKGCWVLALGTNDAANVYVGSPVGMSTRIDRMMSAVKHQPVMWVNVKTLQSSGPYSEPNMKRWDAALVAACARYPNMRVFNWAGMAKASWFTADGIHYTSQGSAPRSAAIADALATAFPEDGRASDAKHQSCVINASRDWKLPTFKY